MLRLNELMEKLQQIKDNIGDDNPEVRLSVDGRCQTYDARAVESEFKIWFADGKLQSRSTLIIADSM